jgi:hypothetical protein
LFSTAEVVEDCVEIQLRFLFNVQARQQHLHGLFVGALGVKANFVGWRGAAAAATTDIDAIVADLLNGHGIEVCNHIRVVIGRG